MSVYKRPEKPFYMYDFTIRGRRYQGSTGKKNKRAALIAEQAEREKALKSHETPDPSKLTLGRLFGFFWTHYGAHDSDSKTTLGRISRLTDGLGGDLRIADLDDQALLTYSLTRRATPTRRGTLPAAASVNREVELLRRVINKTHKPLGFQRPDLDWKEALRKEPEERVVEIKADERAAILAAARDDARPLFEHYLLTGVRMSMAVNLRRDAIDWEAGTVRFIGKGDLETIQPLTPAMRQFYARQVEGNPTEFVFTYVAQRTRHSAKTNGRRTVKGQRYPYSREQVRTLWRRTIERAAETVPSVTRLRLHDTRHDFATKVYRATRDPYVTQRLLGHRDQRSTRRYVHHSTDEIEAALAKHQAAQIIHCPNHCQEPGLDIRKLIKKEKVS